MRFASCADPPAVTVISVGKNEWREGDGTSLICSASGGRPVDLNYVYKCAPPVLASRVLSFSVSSSNIDHGVHSTVRVLKWYRRCVRCRWYFTALDDPSPRELFVSGFNKALYPLPKLQYEDQGNYTW